MLRLGKLKAEIKHKREKEHAAREASSSTAIMEENGNRGQLIPRIPNHITLQTIIPHLPWGTVQTLSAVSRVWQGAVRSRAIHEERARLPSTQETLVVFNNSVSLGVTGIVLYSLRTGAWRQLPPIPHVQSGIPKYCECITLDGKIYILGGSTGIAGESCEADVYVFDVAGQAQTWEKRASMHKARCRFGCGIIAGKIYVCGGCYHDACVSGTEVYDPNVDAWTELMPMLSGRTAHKVGIVENEILVFEGLPNSNDLADYFEIYNPISDKWRRVSADPRMRRAARFGQTLFVVEGELHGITGSDVFKHDLETNVRTHLHSIQLPKLNYWTRYRAREPLAVLAVDGQLLAFDFWYEYQIVGTRIERDQKGQLTFALLRAKGFGGMDQEIVWERILYSLSFDFVACPFLHVLRV